MMEPKKFWDRFWHLFGLHLHYFVIDEKNREDGQKTAYFYYKRRFWHFYRVGWVEKDGQKVWVENHLWEAHLEIPIRKLDIRENLFAIRFHIGNLGSETPWDGHLTLFGTSFYWGHSGFRKLAAWLTSCSGYSYDTRNWLLRISDNRLWWEIAQHDDMCNKHNRRHKDIRKKRWPRRSNSWRRGSINLSIPEAIWGPKRYTYEDHGVHQTVLTFPDGEYAVILTLQRMFYGRTKVDRKKHTESWTVDVDAPRGIPTHVDHSGGWKGDRTFGFGVKLLNVPDVNYWEEIAEVAVREWVIDRRLKTGFVKPDPLEV